MKKVKYLPLLKENMGEEAALERAALLGIDENTELPMDDPLQVRLVHKLERRSEDHVLQGTACHKGIIFQGYDGGRCMTYRLDNGEKLGEFHLGSFYTHNHCGNLIFGTQYPKGNDCFPALYVSGDLTTKACYVESVTETSAVLLQTIYFDIEPSTYTGGQVILDFARNRLVYMQREFRKINDPQNVYRMCEFPIPSFDDGAEIHFTNADMLCPAYVMPFYPTIYQAAYIEGNMLLQSFGRGIPCYTGAVVGLVCYDTATHEVKHIFDLTPDVDVEPEGLFVEDGRVYLCFVNGELYELAPRERML